MVPILRDSGLAEQVRPGDLELLARGFVFTEGPLELPDGSVLFQDIKAGRTYRVDMRGNVSLIREHTGAANGQTWGPSGRVVFCEQDGRRVSELDDVTGMPRTLLETWQGRRLNSPNDIVARSD